MNGLPPIIALAVNTPAEPLPWHRHPLLGVLTGFVLSGVLLTGLTRWLQGRASDGEVRRAVVRDMTEAVHQMLQAVQAVEVQTGQPDLVDLNTAWGKWKTTAAVIGSRLRLYFPPSPLAANWETFVDRMDNFYAMQQERDQKARGQLIIGALSGAHEKRELTDQEKEYRARKVPLERIHWSWLRDELLDQLAQLERCILQTKVASR